MIQYHIYPGGKKRIVTFSYDDGHSNDERLVKLFNQAGVKGTFHLNGQNYKKATEEEKAKLRKLYEGHEISCHTLTHGWPARMTSASVITETMLDRVILEDIAQYAVVGMSYPSGSYNDEVKRILKSCGILYSRTADSTDNFLLPEDFLEWHPTCHHRDALPLCDKFIENLDNEWTHPLLYIWGHSHELRTEEDWKLIEQILEKVSRNKNIWYATNIEIFDYMNAQKQLRISADESIILNPTNIDVWIEKDRSEIIQIPAGSTVVCSNK